MRIKLNFVPAQIDSVTVTLTLEEARDLFSLANKIDISAHNPSRIYHGTDRISMYSLRDSLRNAFRNNNLPLSILENSPDP